MNASCFFAWQGIEIASWSTIRSNTVQVDRNKMLQNPKIVVFFSDFSNINVFWQKDALYVDRQMSTKSEKLFFI